ncbi:hypothetical protein WJX73_009117 [Symbiochloris irregularis]|uniref:Uncharacterized protein n=1 Tax=Symbiochloris irregularis TaxID=706552 RepID=A0AAW1PZ62_9CHLO
MRTKQKQCVVTAVVVLAIGGAWMGWRHFTQKGKRKPAPAQDHRPAQLGAETSATSIEQIGAVATTARTPPRLTLTVPTLDTDGLMSSCPTSPVQTTPPAVNKPSPHDKISPGSCASPSISPYAPATTPSSANDGPQLAAHVAATSSTRVSPAAATTSSPGFETGQNTTSIATPVTATCAASPLQLNSNQSVAPCSGPAMTTTETAERREERGATAAASTPSTTDQPSPSATENKTEAVSAPRASAPKAYSAWWEGKGRPEPLVVFLNDMWGNDLSSSQQLDRLSGLQTRPHTLEAHTLDRQLTTAAMKPRRCVPTTPHPVISPSWRASPIWA